MNQNTSSKDFWKPSVLVWHGLNTNVSQIKKKKVGAWPLCFFLIVAYMIYVFHFSFDISLRKKIFFLWCHTNTHGIDLRRTPHHHHHPHHRINTASLTTMGVSLKPFPVPDVWPSLPLLHLFEARLPYCDHLSSCHHHHPLNPHLSVCQNPDILGFLNQQHWRWLWLFGKSSLRQLLSLKLKS